MHYVPVSPSFRTVLLPLSLMASLAPVHAIAAPSAQPAEGNIGAPIALSIEDGGADEVLVRGVPDDAVLSAGVDEGDGDWLLTAAELAGLTLTPGNSDEFTLTVHPIEVSSLLAVADFYHSKNLSDGAEYYWFSSKLRAGVWSGPVTSYVQFDLSSISGQIRSASFTIFQVKVGEDPFSSSADGWIGGTTGDHELYHVADDSWNEQSYWADTVPPLATGATALGSWSPTQAGTSYTVDISQAAAQDRLAGPALSLAFKQAAGSDKDLWYHSLNSGSPHSKTPGLSLEWVGTGVELDVTVHAPPVFVAPTPEEGESFLVLAGQEVAFVLTAEDADGDTLTYASQRALPDGASFDASSGAFSWTPQADHVGSHSFAFSASDGNSTQGRNISVLVLADSDSDGVEDDSDNCPDDSNEDQADSDGDDLGDACDPVDDSEDTDTDDTDTQDPAGDGDGDGEDESKGCSTVPSGVSGGMFLLPLLLAFRRRREQP